MRKRILGIALAVALPALAPGAGWADGSGPAKAATGQGERYHRTGHQLTLELGAGGDSDNLVAPSFFGNRLTFDTGLSFALAGGYAYRFNPWAAFGVSAHYSLMSATVEGAAQSDDEAFWVTASFGFTGYPLWFTRFDPYVGLSVGYSLWTVPAEIGGSRRNYRLHGVTLQLKLGMNVYVTRFLSVGPVFRYFFPFWIRYCITGVGDHCEPIEDLGAVSSTTEDSLPGLLFFGVQGAFHLQ